MNIIPTLHAGALIVICAPHAAREQVIALAAELALRNRYFGVFQDGEIKYRGIEARRHDTPPWVAKTQLAVLQCLAQAETLEQAQSYSQRRWRMSYRRNAT
jgi:DNA polymerase elongation subunit (family B)